MADSSSDKISFAGRIPVLVVNAPLIAMAVAAVAVMQDPMTALLLLMPATLNVLVAVLPFVRRKTAGAMVFCLAVLPADLLLLGGAILAFHRLKPVWAGLGLFMAIPALAGLWSALDRLIKPAQGPLSGSRGALLWLARIGFALLTIAAVVMSLPDEAPPIVSQYAAGATARELVAMHGTASSLSVLGGEIRKALHGGKPNPGNLDFSRPSERPKVSRPAGTIDVMALWNKPDYVPPEYLALLTGHPGTKIIFNWRRHGGEAARGADQAVFAIIPGVRFCDGTSGYAAYGDFRIAPDNTSPVDDPEDFIWPKSGWLSICVRSSDGKDYYFQRLDL